MFERLRDIEIHGERREDFFCLGLLMRVTMKHPHQYMVLCLRFEFLFYFFTSFPFTRYFLNFSSNPLGSANEFEIE